MTAAISARIAHEATRLVRLPKAMPDNSTLFYIAFPPHPSHFCPSVDQRGRTIPPRIPLDVQESIRLTCRIAGIDAEKVVGLPPQPRITVEPESLIPADDAPLEKLIRQRKVQENMQKMPDRIKAWKEEKRKAKQSAKPDMPF